MDDHDSFNLLEGTVYELTKSTSVSPAAFYLCCPVRVVEWTFMNSERHMQVTFVVTAVSLNVQRGVSTVIRNRAKDY